MTITNENAKSFLKLICDTFEDRKYELSSYDAVIGDGDHGFSVARGCNGGMLAVENAESGCSASTLISLFGRELTKTIGGAIGPLFGSVFTQLGKALKDSSEMSLSMLTTGISEAGRMITELGGAKPGDKTMVDAIVPTVNSLKASEAEGKSLELAIIDAVAACEEGVLSTIPLIAKRGRSKYLQEKAIGHQDAGASSFMYVMKCLRSFICEKPLIWDGDKFAEKNAEVLESKKEGKKTFRSKKFYNSTETIVEDTVSAFCSVYSDRVRKVPGESVVVRRKLNPGKVGVIIGNGSGHEPACIGFVGKNALTANAYGNIFAAAGPNTILSAIKETDTGAGVVLLISNHAGDILNAKVAESWAAEDGHRVISVPLYDDVLSAPKDKPQERRGTAGTFFSYRMVGAYAEQGHTIEEVAKKAEEIRDNTRTVMVASVPGTSPISGEPTFEIADDEYDLGIGVHGEASASSIKVCPASELAPKMCDILLEDGEYKAGEELIVLVNGCGQTTYGELMIFYGEVEKYLNSRGISVFKPAVGTFITTQEMGGISLAFTRATEEQKVLWTSDTDAPAFPRWI